MSRRLINLNNDLKALEKDGYEVAIKGDHLVVSNVPYLRATMGTYGICGAVSH